MPLENKDVLEPGVMLLGYRVLELVGEGAWSYVYKAQHPELPLFVAIKQLKPERVRDSNALQRFLREANTVAKIDHPNVVKIHDLKHDKEAGLYYIITEFAGKGSLAHRLEKSPEGLPIDEVLHLAMGICSGLGAVHRKGVVHLDIKPSNILLFDVGEDQDVPKLGDFGIADMPATVDAGVGLGAAPGPGLYGTIYYMSPERLDQNTGVDHRSDLYSLGILLYELLTGRVPFVGEVQEVFWSHMYLLPKRPSEIRTGVPEELEHIVLRALYKDRKFRYQSAEDMYEALRAIEDIKVRRERQQRFVTLLHRGLEHLEEKDWGEAIEVLRQADVLEPGNEQVQEGLRKAHQQQEVSRLYDRALKCLEAESWEDARQCLARVIGCDPDYAGGQAMEQLERATQALVQERGRYDLMVRYHTGMGYFHKWQWARVIEELEQVVAQDPGFEDAADRLADARRFVRASELFQEAQHWGERAEWGKAVDLLEEVESLRPPHIDVASELARARKRRSEAKKGEDLAAYYGAAVVALAAGNLEQARASFQKILREQPDYHDVADRVRDLEKKIDLKQLYEQASEHEKARDWTGAIKVYQEILSMDAYNHEATRRLARAQICVSEGMRGRLVRAAVRVQNGWGKQDRRAKAVCLAVFLAFIVAACLFVSCKRFPLYLPAFFSPSPTVTSAAITNEPAPTFTRTPTLTRARTLTPTPTNGPTSPAPTLTPTETPSPTPLAPTPPPTNTPVPPTKTSTPTPTTTPTLPPPSPPPPPPPTDPPPPKPTPKS